MAGYPFLENSEDLTSVAMVYPDCLTAHARRQHESSSSFEEVVKPITTLSKKPMPARSSATSSNSRSLHEVALPKRFSTRRASHLIADADDFPHPGMTRAANAPGDPAFRVGRAFASVRLPRSNKARWRALTKTAKHLFPHPLRQRPVNLMRKWRDRSVGNQRRPE